MVVTKPIQLEENLLEMLCPRCSKRHSDVAPREDRKPGEEMLEKRPTDDTGTRSSRQVKDSTPWRSSIIQEP